MLELSSIVLNTCISPLEHDLRDMCTSVCHDFAYGIFSIHFQFLYTSWIILVHMFFMKSPTKEKVR
jgi:hypothetical protein